MAIKASAAAETRRLVDALAADDDVRREIAIARLGIIGSRAVDRLIQAYATQKERTTRVAILRALEGIGDARSAPLARQALAEGGDVAVAAAAVLRTVVSSRHAATAAGALDALVSTSLDIRNDRRVRLAAFDALQDLSADVRARVRAALDADGAGGVGDVARMPDRDAAGAEAIWTDAIAGRLPDTPHGLRETLVRRAPSVPLNTLRRLVDAIRSREAEDRSLATAWLALRGAIHQALALRGSRVALYDLRETIESGPAPLPVSFLTALHVIGDVSCLEPVAAAWGAAGRDATPAGERWRQQLASAFAAIADREKITRRHAVMKRIAAKWPGLR